MADAVTNLAFIVSSLSDMGGSVRVATQLANRLCVDYRVVFIELSSRGESFFPLDDRVARIDLGVEAESIAEKVKALRAPLSKCLREQEVDVLLGIAVDETCAAVVPAKATGTKLVFCDHGALINEIDKKKTTFLRFALSRICDRTVVLTQASKRDYLRVFHLPGKKIVCIPNWIPDDLKNRACSYDPSIKRILWAGRLDREKGTDLLFDVAKRVLPSHEGWTWDVFGSAILGTGGFDLRNAVEEAGLGGRLNLLGNTNDLYERYADYSIGTLTSYREGLPLFLLEGKASRLPLISFDVDTGPREILEDGVDGYLIEPYDCEEYARKLALLMEDDALRMRMSEANPETIERFSEDRVYGLWCRLVDELRIEG